MKKKPTIIALIVLALLLVFPIYNGTKTFSALTYKIVCRNRTIDAERDAELVTGKDSSVKTEEDKTVKHNTATEPSAKPFEEPSVYVAVSDPKLPSDIADETVTKDLLWTETKYAAESETVYGTVTKIIGSILQAEIGENKTLYNFTVSENTQLKIDGKEANINDFKIGDEVKIIFDYPVAESYPLQAHYVKSIVKQ